MSLLKELQRRNVIRVATAYVVVAWLVIQVVETIFPAYGFSDKAVRVVVTVFAIGFIPTLIAAWVFEFTSAGLKLDSESDQASIEPKASSRNLDRAIIVVLILGISFFALDKFVLAPDRAATREAIVAEQAKADAVIGFYGDRSIAVLPFVNMSADPEQEYFGDGVAEEVLNLLASIRDLRVISRSSAFSFKGQNLEIPEIAARLDVAHILEGSVRKAGSQIRVTAQLIEAKTDTHLWSQTYDRDLQDIFAVQDEIAADVALNLKLQLLEPIRKSRVTDPEVHALTLQVNQIWQSQVADAEKKMQPLLDAALALDPKYVPALELQMMANFLHLQAGLLEFEYEQEEWDKLARRIREVDPDNSYVPASKAWQLSAYTNNFEGAAELYELAIANGAGDSETVRLAGSFARFIGKIDTAIELGRYSVAIDPFCVKCLYQLSRTYLYGRQYEEAIATRNRYMALGAFGGFHLGLMILLNGDAVGTLEIANEFDNDDTNPQPHALRAMAYHELGNDAEKQAAMAAVLAIDDGDDVMLAEVYAYINQPDLAFETLQRVEGAQDRLDALGELKLALFDNLRSDPRWEELVESWNFSQSRLDAIDFNPILPK